MSLKTTSSDWVLPSTIEFVESPTIPSIPSSEIVFNSSISVGLPTRGLESNFQSPV